MPCNKTLLGLFSHSGPENWHKNFPVAAGENQSPIDIDTHDVLYDPYLGDINFYGYHSSDTFLSYRLRNTGFAVKVGRFITISSILSYTNDFYMQLNDSKFRNDEKSTNECCVYFVYNILLNRE